MYINVRDNSVYELGLNLNELRVVLSCVGDTFANLNEAEFPSRLGASLEVVKKLSSELSALMDQNNIDI
jgi:hypothetical protein